MSDCEYRQDALTGRWVIVSPGRSARPQQAKAGEETLSDASDCPFCRGHEGETPPERFVLPADGPWQVRVVPNKYPAVMNGGELGRLDGMPEESEGFFPRREGYGAHEVIIESPEHLRGVSDLTVDEFRLVLEAYVLRLSQLAASGDELSAVIFKNVGARAGASLDHTHSQLLAVPGVPPILAQKMACGEEWLAKRGACAWCEMMAAELAAGTRLVAESENFVAYCPYAGRFPYEVLLLPREHGSHFMGFSPGRLMELASLWRDVVERMQRALGNPPYNYVLQTQPLQDEESPFFHWHVELYPRMTTPAGFEWGTGMFINPVAPEEAARQLRAAAG